jgi:hypothetical protein
MKRLQNALAKLATSSFQATCRSHFLVHEASAIFNDDV